MHLVISSIFSVLTLSECNQSPTLSSNEEPQISVESADDFNSHFTRYGPGWTGGDATYSVPLPDGRVVWFFGDTFLGIVNEDRSRSPQKLVNNSFMVQNGSEFKTLPSTGESALLIPSYSDMKYWPQHGFVKNNKLYVLLYAYKLNGTAVSFGFDFVRMDLATFSLPDITLEKIETVSDNKVIWGASVMEEDGYIYIYGSVDNPAINQVNLARINIANLEGPWEYYTSFGWSGQ